MTQNTITDLQASASKFITGGMSSSFRANQFTGRAMFADKAEGPRFTDPYGKEYIDFFMCHGAVLLGHNQPDVVKAVKASIDRGYFAGFDSTATIKFAEKLCGIIPAAEELRFVNSGTEGTLLSLRLARGYTERDKVIRMDGHFHGIQDYLVANNLSSKVDYENDGTRASRVIGRTAGVPDIVDNVVVTLPWNNIGILEKTLKAQGEEIAAIIMNVIDYNNGCFLTTAEYLIRVRELCDKYGIVLIFDEILSGFKTGYTCGQGYYGVTPDICTLGKALTNDVPLSIVTGKHEIMKKIMDPVNPVVAGGTFSGNQLGVSAGNAVLEIITEEGFYEAFLGRVNYFYENLRKLFQEKKFPAVVDGLGAGFHIYTGMDKAPVDYSELKKVDRNLAKAFFTGCIDKGLYFHTDFTVSAAHKKEDLDEALNRMEDVIEELKF